MLDLGTTFLQSVERSPHALALVDSGVHLTYAQWHEQIGRTVAGLERLARRTFGRPVRAACTRCARARLSRAGRGAGALCA